jgi:hypothetical protein
MGLIWHPLLTDSRAITRDEERYPDAEAFNPARWIDPAFPTYREPLTRYPNLSSFSQFGFGRRTCQGIPVVEQDLFLTMGGIAWAFDIRKKRDPATKQEMPVHWADYTPLLIAKPEQFPFEAVPRAPDKMDRMREMYETARDLPLMGKSSDMDIGQFWGDLGDRIYGDEVSSGGERTPSPGASSSSSSTAVPRGSALDVKDVLEMSPLSSSVEANPREDAWE